MGKLSNKCIDGKEHDWLFVGCGTDSNNVHFDVLRCGNCNETYINGPKSILSTSIKWFLVFQFVFFIGLICFLVVNQFK